MSNSELVELLKDCILDSPALNVEIRQRLAEIISEHFLSLARLSSLGNLLEDNTYLLYHVTVLFPTSTNVEKLLAIILQSFLPPCHNGFGLLQRDRAVLQNSTTIKTRAPQLDSVNIDSFLHVSVWTEATASIVASLIYFQRDAHDKVITWLTTRSVKEELELHWRIPLIHAYLDTSLRKPTSLKEHEQSYFTREYKRFLRIHEADNLAPETLELGLECMAKLGNWVETVHVQEETWSFFKKLEDIAEAAHIENALAVGFSISENNADLISLAHRQILAGKALERALFEFSSDKERSSTFLSMLNRLGHYILRSFLKIEVMALSSYRKASDGVHLRSSTFR